MKGQYDFRDRYENLCNKPAGLSAGATSAFGAGMAKSKGDKSEGRQKREAPIFRQKFDENSISRLLPRCNSPAPIHYAVSRASNGTYQVL